MRKLLLPRRNGADNLVDNYGSQRPPAPLHDYQVLTISSDKVDVVRKLTKHKKRFVKGRCRL